MTIGLRDSRDPKRCVTLPAMLAIPFIGSITGYAITNRTWGNSGSATNLFQKINTDKQAPFKAYEDKYRTNVSTLDVNRRQLAYLCPYHPKNV